MIRNLFQIDLSLLLPAVFLSSFGLLIIYSVSFDSDPSLFARQSAYIVFSLAAFLIVSTIDFKLITHLWLFWYVLIIILLIATLAVGTEKLGSTRWLDLGLVTVQTSEFAKPILILSLASFLAKFPPTNLRNFLISAFLAFLPAFLIFRQPDLGSSVIIGLIWLFMVFIAGVNLAYFLGTLVCFLSAAPFFWSLLADYQKTRILSFLNPRADPLGANYSVAQALIALGSGQVFGQGLGRGTQSHLQFLPAEGTDFIFASAGEELGFVGVGLIIVIGAFLVWRLLKNASQGSDRETSFLIFGVAFVIFSQFIINAGMNVGLLPVTGITLPFVSFGGSSLLSMFILLGLAQAAKRKSRSLI